MDLSSITALSPTDGRYRSHLSHLARYFSEYALIRYRIISEVEYLIALSGLKIFSLKPSEKRCLRSLYEELTPEKAQEVKELEKATNHDVKAVEYYIKKELEALRLGHLREFVHFGLTSQDINNTAIPMMWRDALDSDDVEGCPRA